jgi:hypothetical protein
MVDFVQNVLESDVYDHNHVINFDETSVSRDAPPNYTLDKRGTSTVGIKTSGVEKTNYTIGLSITLTGEKLRSVLIWPAKGRETKKCVVPDNVYLYYREKSWMDKNLLLKWIDDVIAKRTRKIQEGKKGLVIFDGVIFHRDKEVFCYLSFINHDSFSSRSGTN